ncbi:MAG: VWA domain-containing protein, partial [Myxococcales bacterium]|nr:VWA domain-containing protein [Myxococcales bacterium]
MRVPPARFVAASLIGALAAACAAPQAPPVASPRKELSARDAAPPRVRGATDVLRLHRLGVSDANLLAGIAQATDEIRVTEEDLRALRDGGVSPEVVAALRARAAGDSTPSMTGSEAMTLGSTVIVLDASSSMADRVDGVPKIAMAKVVLIDWLESHPEASVGVVVFGHRPDRGCDDVEVLVPPAPGGARPIRDALNGVYAQGRSPLADAIDQAGALAPEGSGARLLVVTDGRGGCGRDACAAA